MQKTCFIIAAMLIILAGAAMAETSRLEIVKAEISSGGKTLASGTSGSFKVEQGAELTITIRLENEYSDSSENDIEDVRVEAKIRDIDDGGDVKEYEDGLHVRADGYKTMTLRLEIPEDADTDQSYDLRLTAEGTDKDGKQQMDELYFELEVIEEEEEEDEDSYYSYPDYRYDSYYDGYRNSERVERPVEQYTNPNRDLSQLFGPETQEVVLEVPPQAPVTHRAYTAPKGNTLDIVALSLANVAIIIFIILLISALRKH